MVDRHARVPNANNPQLLWRLVDALAEGNRSTRALGEALGIDPRTVAYYEQAAIWLGLLDETSDLTPLGLELAYAGDNRAAVHARACWEHPVAGRWLDASDGELPSHDLLSRAISSTEPDLSPVTVDRRASAVRGLLAPATRLPRPRLRGAPAQLGLPFHTIVPNRSPDALVATSPQDPDAYAWVLRELIDRGEMSLGNLRALLDGAGATELQLGECVDLALRRGDAVRVEERIICTADAVARADLTCFAAGVVLTDSGYRDWLFRRAVPLSDEVARRYRSWDKRLFGGRPRAEELEHRVASIIPDRPLAALPLASGPGPVPIVVQAPFLDRVGQADLTIAFPPELAVLSEGAQSMDRLLRNGRQRDVVALPGPFDRPTVVHSGLVHPGEVVPRTVPDARSLRIRAISHCPAVTLITAALLAHRRSRGKIEVYRRGQDVGLRVGGKARGPLLEQLALYGRSRGWVVCHRSGAGRLSASLVPMLVGLGVASSLERRLVLSERLYAALRTEPEEGMLYEPLAGLADSLEAWVDS